MDKYFGEIQKQNVEQKEDVVISRRSYLPKENMKVINNSSLFVWALKHYMYMQVCLSTFSTPPTQFF